MKLFKNLGNLSCTYCTSTLADCETETLVKSYWVDEFNCDCHVVSRHYHLNSLWKSNLSGDVKGTDEELWTVVVVEWSMTTTFIFLQNVNLSLEFLVRVNNAWFSKHLSSLDFLLVDTTEEETYVVTGFSLIEEFAEHLDTCYGSLLRLFTETYDLNLFTYVDYTSLDTACCYCTTASD